MTAASRLPAFDVDRVRAEFPALHQEVHGRPLAYLDNAATTQKPRAVIDALVEHYTRDVSNVHRGVHQLSQRATDAFEGARARVRRFLGARHDHEIVFVRGTTEALNLLAHTLGRLRVGEGDEVLITGLEHHSNIVPWQMLCRERRARLRVVPLTDAGEVELGAFEAALGPRTRLVAMTHVSNALGTVLPVAEVARLAHARGVPVVVDGAQAAQHLPVDVQALGCDFYAFSGHKVFGPTGIGALYGRAELLAELPPWQGGGEMIRRVTFEETTFADPPARFEAGTPDIAGAIGLGAALAWLGGIDRAAALAHERELLEYATARLGEVPGLRIVGTAREKAGLVSFVIEGIHPHDVGTIVDHEGVAIRTGHHCAQPVMDRFGLPATSRASFALYNTRGEIDRLVEALHRAREILA